LHRLPNLLRCNGIRINIYANCITNGVGNCGGDVEIQTRALDAYPEDEDLYGIGSSNSVVARMG